MRKHLGLPSICRDMIQADPQTKSLTDSLPTAIEIPAGHFPLSDHTHRQHNTWHPQPWEILWSQQDSPDVLRELSP